MWLYMEMEVFKELQEEEVKGIQEAGETESQKSWVLALDYNF